MTETPETLWVTFDQDGNMDDCTPDQQGAYDYARRSDYSSPVPYVLKEKFDELSRCHDRLESLRALASRWERQEGIYDDTPGGRAAAAVERSCARELRAELEKA